jgi:hypothetical protein
MAALCIASLAAGGAQMSMDFPLSTPRLLSITSAPVGDIPAMNLLFNYDSTGKALCAAGSEMGQEPVSGHATVLKKNHGPASYTVNAKGMNGLILTLKGQLGSGVASASYKAGAKRAASANLAVTASFISPVQAHFSLISQTNTRGQITGSGTIASGYDNDSQAPGVLSGKSTKSQLTWRLKQGGQQISFIGKNAATGAIGMLTVNLPPDRGSYKPFAFPGFAGTTNPVTTNTTGGGTGPTNQTKGVMATFKGSVSQIPLQGGFPAAVAGATVTVHSDLNGDGVVQNSEQFTTQSDAEGNYSLSGQVLDGGRAIIQVSLDGYAREIKIADAVRAGSVIVNNIVISQLAPLTVSGAGAASLDGKLELKGLPPQIASIQARTYNPVTEANHFPGEFADDKTNMLLSAVFANFDARDGSGNSVTNLGNGASLRMQIPKETWGTLIDQTPGNNQIDVPLYYFDEGSGKWVRSANDGWLEDAGGAKIPEDQLSAIQAGSFAGLLYAAGPITHLSWWNCDHPISEHGCLHAVIVDASGAPVVGVSVSAVGLTYNGSSAPKITAADGSFCSDVMRSEAPGEDINGNGIFGEVQQAFISVTDGTNYYRFGPYTIPTTQGTCSQGTCMDLAKLVLTDSNLLTVALCPVSGQYTYADGNQPVSGAFVLGYDPAIGFSQMMEFLTNGASIFSTTDSEGMFSLTTPVLVGLNLISYQSTSVTDNVQDVLEGQATFAGCPSGSVNLLAQRIRQFTVFDAAQTNVGYLWQYQFAAQTVAYFTIGTTHYSARATSGSPIQFPSQPGESMTLDLYLRSASGPTKVGTMTFMATSALGGTCQTTGVSFSGSWGN